jgi:hypothetical protein
MPALPAVPTNPKEFATLAVQMAEILRHGPAAPAGS